MTTTATDLPRLPRVVPDWHDDGAACRLFPELDFVEPKGPAALACRVICRACPLRLQCATDALERGEPWGIWGGLDRRDRKAVALELGYPAPAVLPEHGTNSRYAKHDCRCRECRDAHAVYEFDRRARARRAARGLLADTEATPTPSTESVPAGEQVGASVRASQHADNVRQVVHLHHEGLTPQEIAGTLALHRNTVWAILREADLPTVALRFVDFGQRVRVLRERAGLGTGALGARIGLTWRDVARLEAGGYTPTVPLVGGLVRAFAAEDEREALAMELHPLAGTARGVVTVRGVRRLVMCGSLADRERKLMASMDGEQLGGWVLEHDRRCFLTSSVRRRVRRRSRAS
ncbi:WhiB family transcriptional regulator [Amycolatopsis japonica]|uniref:WhiB family transcriptional regulator n=1 Tax=Amycolatopsis japonica TaxID=208439 RepID=UPI00366E8133